MSRSFKADGLSRCRCGISFVVLAGSPPKAVEEQSNNAMDQGVDPLVNGTMTCEHGRLKGVGNRAYRLISAEAWNKVKSLFPKAVEFPFGTEVSVLVM